MYSKKNRKLMWWGSAVTCVIVIAGGLLVTASPQNVQPQNPGQSAQAHRGSVARNGAIMPMVPTGKGQAPTAAEKDWLEKAAGLVNRARPATPQDGQVAGHALPANTASSPLPLASGDYWDYNRTLTDVETNNSTSVINEPSVAMNYPKVIATANWYMSYSTDGMNTFNYINQNSLLPAIAGQFFCCDQSVVYDAKRNIFVWLTLYINSGATTGTLRFVVIKGDFSAFWVYDLGSASFGLAGLPDYPHIALGANVLYLTINHFNPSFTMSTVARLPLQEMSQGQGFTFNYINRSEFNWKAAHDYGPGTTGYAATHLNNSTLRVIRWQEGSGTYFTFDVPLPHAWTRGGRGQFTCPTPTGQDPCARMDDRIQGGFITGPKRLPPTSTAQEVVGFSWTARQGGSFPYPYTEVVRIDTATMTAIDQPPIWNSSVAFFYADIEPNDRGDLGGILDMAGSANQPTIVSLSLREEVVVPAPWDLHVIRPSNAGPTANTWGDYNTARVLHPYRYLFIGAGRTLQSGGANGNAETTISAFGRMGDVP